MEKDLYKNQFRRSRRCRFAKVSLFLPKTAAKIFVRAYSFGEAASVSLQNSNTFLPTTDIKCLYKNVISAKPLFSICQSYIILPKTVAQIFIKYSTFGEAAHFNRQK